MNLQNGTLDTRLPQNIIRNFEIPANVEHDKLNPFKIGGGNAIWITHIPANVNVWFSTNQNFDNAQKLDYMNRGMRFMSIGSDGLQQQYDNFYIFTEGVADDIIKICVSTQGDSVEPILSSNTNQIDQVDTVALINKIGGFTEQAKKDLNDAIYNYFAPPKLIKQIKIQGEYVETVKVKTKVEYICLPLDGGIKSLNLDDNKFYKLVIFGHIDIGGGNGDDNQNTLSVAINAHLSLFKNTNNAIFKPVTRFDIDNFYTLNKTPWASEKTDLFDIFGMKNKSYYRYTDNTNITQIDTGFQDYGLNFNNDMIFEGSLINSYDNICLKIGGGGGDGGGGSIYMHSSLLLNLYEMKNFL